MRSCNLDWLAGLAASGWLDWLAWLAACLAGWSLAAWLAVDNCIQL